MTDRSFPLGADADLEAALRGLADAIDWPVAGPTPAGGTDLAAVVRARIEAGEAPAPARGWFGGFGSWRPARRLLVIALVVVLTLTVLAALAGAAGLGLPGLRITLGDPGSGPSLSPPPTAAPSSTPAGPPGSRMRLGTPVDLADLDAAAGFAVGWPSDPALGPPDAAYIDPSKNGQVALVWAARPDLPPTLEPGVGLVLTAFRGGVDDGFYNKVINNGATIRGVRLDDGPAYWLSGVPHMLFYENAGGAVFDERRWVGDALLWADGPITYRLESALGMDRTVELAESLP